MGDFMSRRIFLLIMAILILAIGNISVCAKIIKRGDLNNDGKTDAVDYTFMRKKIADDNDSAFCIESDVNNDNTFDAKDILAMAKYLAKIGDIYSEEVPCWNTVYNWESYSEGTESDGIDGITKSFASVKTKSLDTYSVVNTKNQKSKIALSILANGMAGNSSGGSNPTTGEAATTISTEGKLSGATNLRVSMNIINKLSEKYYSVYIGCKLKSGSDKNYNGTYFCPVEVISYSEEFNYFYFVGKEFTKKSSGRFTYLDEPVTKVLQKEDIPNIQSICIWMEEDRSNDKVVESVYLMIDDIEYYDGTQGYDSSAEDALLKTEESEMPDGSEKYLAVAFDDGPRIYTESGKYYMEYYMDLADKYNAHFTYFLNGNENRFNDTNGNPNESTVNLLKSAVAKGHELGNHTWSHANLTEKTEAGIIKEISDVDNWLSDNIGVTSSFIRLPSYKSNENVLNTIKNKLPNIKATIYGYCPNDFNNTSVDYRKWYYKKNISDGTITLTHENYIDNVEVVEWMLEYYTNLGYKFVTVSELFEIKGVTPQLGAMYYSVK